MKKVLAIVFVITMLFCTGCVSEPAESADSSVSDTSDVATSTTESASEADESEVESTNESSFAETSSATEGTTGKGDTTNTTTKNNATTATSTSKKETTTTTKKKLEVKDLTLPKVTLENKTIRYLRNGALSSQEEDILTIAKAKYGLQVEIVNSGTGAEPMRKLAQMVNAGESPDIMDFDDMYYLVAKQNKLFQSLKDLIDWDDPKFADGKEATAAYDYYVAAGEEPRWVLWYNVELFEQAGLKTPLYYLQKNEWTWSKLNELAKKLTSENGEVRGFAAESGLFGTRLASTGKDMIKLDGNGKYVSNLADPVFQRIITEWLNMTKDGYYYLGQDGANNFKKGRLAMYIGGKWLTQTYKMQDMVSSGAISFVPVPRDDEADDYYYMTNGNGTAVVAGAQNLDGALVWLHCKAYYYAMARADKTQAAKLKENRQKSYGWTELEFQMEDYIDEELTHLMLQYPSVGGVDGWYGKVWEMATAVIDHQKPWATVKEEYEPLLNAELKKIYG